MKGKAWSAPYIFWMTIFVVAPLLLVVFFATTNSGGQFTLENFRNMNEYIGVFSRSIILSVIATMICLIIGYPFSYFLSREIPLIKNSATTLIMLPMWMNFLLRTYAWMSLLENNGLINRFLAMLHLGPFTMINTQGAVVLGMVYNYLPFMILPIYSVIDKIDEALIEAAQDLGSNTLTVFRKVILPLSLPGVLSGVTMVFVPAVSTFVISKLLGGGNFMLVGDLIEMQFLGNAYNPHLGSAISLVMMVLVLICVAVMNRFGAGEEEVAML